MSIKHPIANAQLGQAGLVAPGDQYLGWTGTDGKVILKLGVQVPEADFSTWPGSAVYIRSNSGVGIHYRRLQSTGTFATMQTNDGTTVGSITCTAAATAYNTSSDERLKEDIKPLENATDKIMAIQPRIFTWKTTGQVDQGFIAQELHQVVPAAVTVPDLEGQPEEFNEAGLPKNPWAVDPSKLVVLLVGAMQEMKKEIDDLKEQVAKGGGIS